MQAWLAAEFDKSVAAFTAHPAFVALESGEATQDAYDAFLANALRTHLRSPKILAFLFALAPAGQASDDLLHNLLEELGVEEEDGTSHPDLLRQVAVAAGMVDRLPAFEAQANADLRQIVCDPLLYGSLREVGLAALAEMVAFEYMLSRTASRMARFLGAHRDMAAADLGWFTHHAEVDIAHAEQGLANLERYVAYYGFAADEAETIITLVLRENVFIKRYFGELAFAQTLEND